MDVYEKMKYAKAITKAMESHMAISKVLEEMVIQHPYGMRKAVMDIQKIQQDFTEEAKLMLKEIE